jgi:TetR/AcrR family transcriptional repressor of nem operon
MPAKGEKTKRKIVETAADLVYRQGFRGTGLQEILGKCEVPKGSFYFHFPSKEVLGREVVRLRRESVLERISKTFSGDNPVQQELARWFDQLVAFQKGEGHYCGCPVGNLAQEMSAVSERLRGEVTCFFAEAGAALTVRFCAAQAAGELPQRVDPRKFAAFFLQVSQGALLLSKVEQSTRPLQESKEVILALLGKEGEKGRGTPKGDT